MEQNKKIGYKDIFKQKEYMKMMVAALINRFGDSIDAIAFTWIVYELTGSAVWSAVIFGVNKVPSVFVTPLAGAWVEGRNKKAIMIITDLIRAFCVAFVASGYLLGFLQPWMLLVTTCIISTVEAFRGPAGSALTPRVLQAEYYEYGMSLMSTFSSVTELAGTMAAGGIIAVIGAAGAIYLDMATFLLSALIICFVNTREERSRSQIFDGKAYITNLKEGFSYVRKSHEVCYLMVVVLFMNGILVPLNSLEAPMVDEILHGGAEMLSLLSAALTVGMLFGSVTYPVVKKHMSGKKIMVTACVVVAVFLYRNPVVRTVFCKPVVPVRCGDRKQSGIGICGCSYRSFFVGCKCQICESGVSGENQRYHVCGKYCSDAGTFVHHQWTGQFCDNCAVFYFCRCLCTAGVYLDFEE